jgi:hypothetical protein
MWETKQAVRWTLDKIKNFIIVFLHSQQYRKCKILIIVVLIATRFKAWIINDYKEKRRTLFTSMSSI